MSSTCRSFPRERPARCFLPPDPASTALRLADAFFAQRRVHEALGGYQEAIRLGGDPGASAFQRWMCYMLMGRFEDAWFETDRSESARRAAGITTRDLPRHMQRVWNGKPLAGKRVLVRCYHGLGDTIQFFRYIPLLCGIASEVCVQCQQSLIPLLRSMRMPGQNFIGLDNQGADLKHHIDIELMELPYAFRTTLNTIPSDVPYLRVPHVTSSVIPESRGTLRVGLVWSSGSWNPERDIRLGQLRPLADLPGVAFFSLQRGPAAKQIARCRSELPISPGERSSGGILETARALLNLDLVISVDTMVAHLAGALGRPVWTLLPFAADWRWMVERDDSPWYPTMRLFRQPWPGDWGSVVERVTGELSRWLEVRPSNANS